MRGCFICGGSKNAGKFGVGAWSASDNATRFGLGSVNPTTNEICCSFREGEYRTQQEAEMASKEVDVDELYHELQTQLDEADDYYPDGEDCYNVERYEY